MRISDWSSDVCSSDLKGRMFGRMAKMLLVLSAVAPVGLVYAWVAFNEGNRSVALWLIGGCIFLVFCCVYLFNKAHSVLERFPFQMSSVEAADRENIAFMRSEERSVGKECVSTGK